MAVTSQRTQITLPKELRKEIDRQRRLTGESLGEYLRKSAEERISREKKKKVNLKKLADKVVGSCKGSRTDKEIKEWLKQIRKDREEDDTHRMERLGETENQMYKTDDSLKGVVMMRDAQRYKKK